MSKLSDYIADLFSSEKRPILAGESIYQRICEVYQERKVPYLRGAQPTQGVFANVRDALRKARVIAADDDYKRLWRVVSAPDASAEEIACLADPLCYISHLSAMQRYGLSDRRPEKLILTTQRVDLARRTLKDLFEQRMAAFPESYRDGAPRIVARSHPNVVRDRVLDVVETAELGAAAALRGSWARIASLGQVFVDMLSDPNRCGGMVHVLDVWQEHAPAYQAEIIARVDEDARPILKVRAGYILDERLGIADPRVQAWKAFAQRGSSRVLDPSRPFDGRHSEEWMLSINAG